MTLHEEESDKSNITKGYDSKSFFGKPKGARKTRTRKDTEEYVSKSSIDSPPQSDDDKKDQKEMFEPSLEDAFNAEQQQADRMFNVELVLVLKPKNGKAVKIPVLNGDWRASLVPEALKLAWDARRLKGVLKAVLDVPEVK